MPVPPDHPKGSEEGSEAGIDPMSELGRYLLALALVTAVALIFYRLGVRDCGLC
jgi:hypothetical protein